MDVDGLVRAAVGQLPDLGEQLALAHDAPGAGREFDLLHYLAARAGKVISKRELLTEVWQLPYGGADKTVDVHLSWLRRKLGETAHEPRFLHTVRGVGVRLEDSGGTP